MFISTTAKTSLFVEFNAGGSCIHDYLFNMSFKPQLSHALVRLPICRESEKLMKDGEKIITKEQIMAVTPIIIITHTVICPVSESIKNLSPPPVTMVYLTAPPSPSDALNWPTARP